MIVNGPNSVIPGISSEADLRGVLGKNDFLKLLITQLSHQDPMEPLDNNEFIAQMTQFSSLEQLQGINEGIEASLMLSQSLNNALSTTLLGREVVVQGNIVDVYEGEATGCGFYAPEAGHAEVAIKDESGKIVRKLDIEVDEWGYVEIEWDGCNGEGEKVQDGEYTFGVSFTIDGGGTSPVSLFVTGSVSSVKFLGGNAFLEVGGHEYNLSQIIEIRE